MSTRLPLVAFGVVGNCPRLLFFFGVEVALERPEWILALDALLDARPALLALLRILTRRSEIARGVGTSPLFVAMIR